ncbi:MAG: hypothetical protein N5P05_000487 [Chroococcopsis gigantea SAG 12.99]|jgi:hypothetical protein|nr:hypothetical protein [Chroococcopsis gigantea SAG 12.99]
MTLNMNHHETYIINFLKNKLDNSTSYSDIYCYCVYRQNMSMRDFFTAFDSLHSKGYIFYKAVSKFEDAFALSNRYVGVL